MKSLPERDEEMLGAIRRATREIGVAKQARADAVRAAMDAGIPRRRILKASGLKSYANLYKMVEQSNTQEYLDK